MKIAIIADSHFCENSRWEECIRIHSWIAEDAAKRGCSAWLHAGDVYHRKSTPAERQAVIQWCRAMAEIGPGVIVRGNHDAPVDLWPLGRLDARHPIFVAESPETVGLFGLDVHCLPWPNRASLLGESRESSEQDIGNALRDVLRGFVSREGTPAILLSHAMVRGSRTSHGQPLVGCDCEIGLEDLLLCPAAFYALGHVHMANDWLIDSAPAAYPGSPYRTAFGEVEPKGYLVLEVDEAGLVGWERVETPCTPMLLVDGRFEPSAASLFASVEGVAGAEVRLRYAVTQENRAAAKAAAEESRRRILDAGAEAVKLEEVVEVETRARVPEVAVATALEDQLRAFWDSQNGGGPPSEQRPRLVEKLNLLLGEVS